MSAKAQTVAERLAAGPPQGLGCANLIAAEALRSSIILAELVALLNDKRPLVTARAANALKKVQRAKAEVVTPYGRQIVGIALDCRDLRTRWNLITVVGLLPLKGADKALAVDLMFDALGSGSGFLRTFAMTALVQFAADDVALKRRVRTVVQRALDDRSAAMRARARKLWPKLN